MAAGTLSANVQQAYQFFIGKGLTAAQSAGIVGNLQQESGLNPESVQSAGPGRGIAQWSQGGRWQPSLMTGNAQTDLGNQLNFVWAELTKQPAYGLAQLKQQSTPAGAAQVFAADYERPKVIDSNRAANANAIYAGNGTSSSGGSGFISDVAGGIGDLVTGGISDIAGGLVKTAIKGVIYIVFLAGALALIGLGLSRLTSVSAGDVVDTGGKIAAAAALIPK